MLRFTKMEGLGNDFVVIDGVRQRVSLRAESIRALADRHFGVGCDQVLLVEPADTPHTDFRYRIFNADGSEVEQCGNGARCFARFVRDQGLTDKDVIPVQTRGGRMELRILPDGRVTVDMGPPRLEPAEIPLDVPERRLRYPLELDGEPMEIGAVGMGNPHAIVLVEDVARAPVASLGPRLEIHPLFPKKANVGFLEIVSRDRVRLRVWERGAGETLACGSNACAAVVAGRLWGRLDGRVTVSLPGGDLEISWDGLGDPVLMTGPARAVFEGVWLGDGLKEG